MTGRFVWHDLMTTDTQAAIAFYTEVIGWKTEPFGDGSEGKEVYMMWVGSQGPLGGVMTLPEDAKAMGAPPHWMGHVEVDDIDQAVEKVKALGGQVQVPPTAIPTVGRFTVIVDPQGATLSLFQPEGSMAPHDSSRQGEVSWNELYADDAPAVLPFYRDLLGWKLHEEMDMGEAGKYLIFGQGEQRYGGMMTKTAEIPMPPSWAFYFQVDDLDAALERAISAGANKMFGPMTVPGGTRVAMLTDPQGAVFALHGPGNPS